MKCQMKQLQLDNQTIAIRLGAKYGLRFLYPLSHGEFEKILLDLKEWWEDADNPILAIRGDVELVRLDEDAELEKVYKLRDIRTNE